MKPLEDASLFSPLSPTCQCYWDLLGCSQLHCQCFPKRLHCVVWDPPVQTYLQCGHLHLNRLSAKAHGEQNSKPLQHAHNLFLSSFNHENLSLHPCWDPCTRKATTNSCRKWRRKTEDELFLHIHTYPQHQLPNKYTHT